MSITSIPAWRDAADEANSITEVVLKSERTAWLNRAGDFQITLPAKVYLHIPPSAAGIHLRAREVIDSINAASIRPVRFTRQGNYFSVQLEDNIGTPYSYSIPQIPNFECVTEQRNAIEADISACYRGLKPGDSATIRVLNP